MLDELRQRLKTLQKATGLDNDPALVPFGIAEVDDVLGGGLAPGALHEIAAAGEPHLAAATGFTLGLASLPSVSFRGANGVSEPGMTGKHLIWIAEEMALTESGAPYGPGLDAFMLDPERLLTVTVGHRRELLWSMEEALRCRAIGAAVGEIRHGALDAVAVRRLSLAAAQSGALALLLRASPARDASTAATRWIVRTAPSNDVIPGREHRERTRNPETNSEMASGFRVRRSAPSRNDQDIKTRFAAQLVRNRRGPTGSWIFEWRENDERFILATHPVPVAAPVRDRPHQKIA